MANALEARSVSDMQVIGFPEAQCLASDYIARPDQCWSPTDGANKGKHKLGNNTDTYTNLAFVEGQGGGGSAAWGGITGTLSDQADLIAILNSKLSTVGWTSVNGMSVNVDVSDPDNPVLVPVGTDALLRTVVQANTFTQGQALKVTAGGGGALALAQGDSVANAQFGGFYYTTAGSQNPFKLAMPGSFVPTGFLDDLGAPLVPGDVYYLSTTVAGGITNVKPTGPGEVVRIVLIATSTTGGFVVNEGATLIGEFAATAGAAFTGVLDTTQTFLNANETRVHGLYRRGYVESDGSAPVTMTDQDDIVVAAAGVVAYNEVTDPPDGLFINLVCSAGATSLTFTPLVSIDGNPSLALLTGAKKAIYNVGSGIWITLD